MHANEKLVPIHPRFHLRSDSIVGCKCEASEWRYRHFEINAFLMWIKTSF
jgi:hypothetical protein